MDDIDQATGIGKRIFYWWADRPIIHLLVILAITALTVIGYWRPELVLDLFQSKSKAGQQVAVDEETNEDEDEGHDDETSADEPRPNVQPFRVAGGESILVATSSDFFQHENLSAIRAAVAELESLPQVREILWIESIPGLNPFGLPEPLLPRRHASKRQIEVARERTLSNPMAVGQLISEDGKTMMLHVSLNWFHATGNEESTSDLRVAAEKAAARIQGADVQFRVTGATALHLMVVKNHVRDPWKYQLIMYSIMVVAALVLFRGISAVSIVAIAPAMGVFWTMGIMRFLKMDANPFNDVVVPVLISLVGLADAVHLMVEIRNKRAAGLETRDAARHGVAQVGMACALTSLTTAIGFASLAWAHHAVVREFGWCCVLGVGLTFISVLTVVPLGCRSPLGWRLHKGLGTSLVDSQLKRIGPLVGRILRYDRLVGWIAIGSTLALAAVCTQLEPDERRFSGMSESAEAAQALRHLDKTMGGLEFAYVDVHWNRQTTDAELLTLLREIDKLLDEEPLLGHPLGLHDLLDALPGDGPASERMSLLDLLPPSLKRAFYTPETRHSFIQFRVQDIGIAKYAPVFERLETKLTQLSTDHPNFAVELGGGAVWRWRDIYQILVDLATSLGTASIIIWIILTIVYRSIRIGLISIVPNLFPLVATGSMLWLIGQYLELVTVCTFTICIGIAVDDTIHFLTRYVQERDKEPDHDVAIERAFSGVGSALLMTTIVLVTGMMTMFFSDTRDARLFGIMGSITLSAALFADIFFLPALLKRFAKPVAIDARTTPSQPKEIASS